MNWWILAGIAAIIVFLVVASRLGWVDFTNKAGKRNASGGALGALGAIDEVFAPHRHEIQVERDRQTVVPAPAPVAGDGDKGISAAADAADAADAGDAASRFDGRIRLDL